MTRRCAALASMICLSIAAPAFANTLVVTNTFDNGPGSLRGAIAAAAAGDTISVNAAGVITLTSGPLTIAKNLTIVGPGSSAIAIVGTSAWRVLGIAGGGVARVTMSGFTIRGGHAEYGGGIHNAGTLTLTNMVVTENEAVFGGGGIYNANSLTLVDSVVSNNTSQYHGGGLMSGTNSVITIRNSRVLGNVAAVGGGIANQDGTLSVDATLISQNSAGYLPSVGNAHGGSGGAIYNGGFGGPVVVTNSTISYNVASEQAGGVYVAVGTMTLANSTVAGNVSTCNYGGCSGGGGIYNLQSTISITNSTLFDNISRDLPRLGGNLVSLYGTTTLKNSILAKGTSGPNCFTYWYVSIISQGHNLSDDTSCSSFFTQSHDLNDVAAGLSAAGLQDNGGPTPTIALEAASPAVDAVPTGACTDAGGRLIPDQRGVSRPQAASCDIGAFELILSPSSLGAAAADPPFVIAGSLRPVRLSAVLTSQDTGAPLPDGAVTFFVDGASVGVATTDVSGTASISYDSSSLSVGTHSIQAAFARQNIGAEAFESSSSSPVTFEVQPSPYAAQIQPPVKVDGTSVFNANRGVVPVKFTLAYGGTATCDLPASTIGLVRTEGSAPGPVSESVYAQAADTGSNFRIDANACQYVYNVDTASLGPGTYMVYVAIDGNIVAGRGQFGVR